MEIARAKELLSILADGVNPLTGEVLPDNDSCNQVEIVRALHTAVLMLDKFAPDEKTTPPDNMGKLWQEDEEKQLISEYNRGLSGAEIARNHGRTKGAVAARLVRLGIIEERKELK